MKIILINLPSPALAEPWSNFPLGLGYVAAALEKRGYNIEIIDMNSAQYLHRKIIDFPKSNIYGLSVHSTQINEALNIAKQIKKQYPNSIIVAGGPHTLVKREDFLSKKYFDSVVIEEGEFSFYEVIRHWELYKEVEPVYWNPPIRLIDDIPFPARHLFPYFKENALRTHELFKGDYCEGGQTTIIASRGCPFQCSFCAPHSRKVRFRSPQNAIAEIRNIIDNFGIYQFKWQDDTFTLNPKFVLELCNLLKNQLPKTYHRVHTRVDTFNEDMAIAMKIAGFKILCFGIESFSQELLDLNMKSITIDQIETALKLAKKYEFKTVGFLIFGMPGETEKTVEKTQKTILKNKKYLDYLNLATMVPLLGTPVWSNPDRFNCEIIEHDLSKYWIVNHDANDTILVKTKNVSLEKMKKLKLEMYQFMRNEGYGRPEWKK